MGQLTRNTCAKGQETYISLSHKSLAAQQRNAILSKQVVTVNIELQLNHQAATQDQKKKDGHRSQNIAASDRKLQNGVKILGRHTSSCILREVEGRWKTS